MLTATIFIIFTASTKETTKEVPRPKAAAPLLWWQPQAATFVEAVNIVNIVAVATVLVLHLRQPRGLLAGRAVDRMYGGSDGRASGWLS